MIKTATPTVYDEPTPKETTEPVKTIAKGDPFPWKYNEGDYLAALGKYLSSTYGKHYVGENNIQAFDLINSSGNGEGFCFGNIIKYAARFGKKNGKNRDDILKIIHYSFFALYTLDQETQEKKPEKDPMGW